MVSQAAGSRFRAFSATTRMDKVMYVLLGVITALGLYNTAADIAGEHDCCAGVSVWFRGIFLLQPHLELMAQAPLGFQLHALRRSGCSPSCPQPAPACFQRPDRISLAPVHRVPEQGGPPRYPRSATRMGSRRGPQPTPEREAREIWRQIWSTKPRNGSTARSDGRRTDVLNNCCGNRALVSAVSGTFATMCRDPRSTTRTCGSRCVRTAELTPSAAINTSASAVSPSSNRTVTVPSGFES